MSVATGAPRVLVSGAVLDQPMGGVRRHNQELLPRVARRLAERGGALDVLAPRGGIPFELEGVRVLASDVPSGPPLVRAIGEARALARELARARDERRPYDLVHSAHLPAPRLPAGVARTVTVHDLRWAEVLRRGPAHLGRGWIGPAMLARAWFGPSVLGRALREARAVVTVSATVRDELAARFGVDPARVHVVPNAADHLAPLPRRPGRSKAGAPLLHVGHVEPRKNLELVLRALALDPELPPALFAGASKGGERERLERLASELGVASRVRFTGPFDDARLAELYAEAAAVVLPSRLEGFGIPLLEAMRARVPVTASTAGALPEVAGDAAPLFAPDDVEGCVAAVRAALARTDEELERAAERAGAHSWERSADAFAAALADAAARP